MKNFGGVSLETATRAFRQLAAAIPQFTDDEITIMRQRFGSWWVARHIFGDGPIEAVFRRDFTLTDSDR